MTSWLVFNSAHEWLVLKRPMTTWQWVGADFIDVINTRRRINEQLSDAYDRTGRSDRVTTLIIDSENAGHIHFNPPAEVKLFIF